MSETSKSKKIAIVLFNLGGPDSLKAVKPFLFNLFFDKYIITLPKFFRYFIAWLISNRREKTAQEIYSHTNNKSPILENTIAQKEELEKNLKNKISNDFSIFICMRHWHPKSDEVVSKIKDYKPDEIILIPLYPQFSTTTTASSFDDFKSTLKKAKFDSVPVKAICCYFDDPLFIQAHVKQIKQHIKDKLNYRILFSAHGLPERIILSGDPYQWQIENTVKKIMTELELIEPDYKITYQSRVGPLKWLGPNTEDEIKLAGVEQKPLVIVPIAFVSEHVETLVELDIEYKKIADKYNIDYVRVPALGLNKDFINCLADLIIKFINNNVIVTSNNLNRQCPSNFSKCLCDAHDNPSNS